MSVKSDVCEVISQLVEITEEDDRNREKERLERDRERDERKREWNDLVSSRKVKKAKTKHYAKWLEKYIKAGGKPTYYYDYDMPELWVTNAKNVNLPPLYGADAIMLIVKEGHSVICEDDGHCSLFYMDSNEASRSWNVAVWRDTRRYLC